MAGPVLVLHTTEGTTLAGAKATLDRNRSWSHWLIDPATGKWETLVHSGSARSLRNLSGGVETNNRGGVWQVEIVGKAADVPNYSDRWYQVLAEWVVAICEEKGIPRKFPYPFAGSDAYGTKGKVRLSNQEWLEVEGIIGHQHVPENTHWDPGRIDRLIPLVTGEAAVAHDQDSSELQTYLNRFGIQPDLEVDGIRGPLTNARADLVVTNYSQLAARVAQLSNRVVELEDAAADTAQNLKDQELGRLFRAAVEGV